MRKKIETTSIRSLLDEDKKSSTNVDPQKKLLSLLKEFDFISLDIFDTLITRLAPFPTDIFASFENRVG